jgi:toxin ParE1/3/4
MAHKVALQAEADLEEIWLYVARESSSTETATRLVDRITDRFLLLSSFPFAGRARDRDLGAGLRSFPVGEYVIVYLVENLEVSILRVVHGRRELDRLFGK